MRQSDSVFPMRTVVGIDLGTTSSRIAVMRGGVPVIIENLEGEGTTPSHVAITGEGTWSVGKLARRYALKDPTSVFYSVKRLLGRKYDDPVVQQCRASAPYNIVRAANGDAWLEAHGETFPPAEISALMLRKLKASAEAYLGEPVTDAVIAVPAYFDDVQRQATRDAASIAGLRARRLVSEPNLASLAYDLGNKNDQTIAVYDLGGGTFDITIVEITHIEGDKSFDVLATNGDTFLGGEDFDFRLMQHLARDFKKQTGIDVTRDAIAMQRLKEAAEQAKIELSSVESARVDLPFLAADESGARHFMTEISRATFEGLIVDLVDRTIDLCVQAEKEAARPHSQVEKIVLVGGSTRIPMIQARLHEQFGLEPYGQLRREDAVALGAAIQAGVLDGTVRDVLLLDVLPISVGIETAGGVFTKLIDRNTTIPFVAAKVFSTASDNQPSVSIRVFQGERGLVADNTLIGEFELGGIPPARKGMPQIEVEFFIDANGILQVFAKNKGTGEEQAVTINVSSGLEEQDISRMAARVWAPAELRAGTTGDLDSAETGLEVLVPAADAASATVHDDRKAEEDAPAPDRIPRVFISYAHEDEEWCRSIETSLSLLVRTQRIELWTDRKTETGEYWEDRIYSEIEIADFAILVISKSFLDSDFILEQELPRIFAEKERRYLRVLPVMSGHCPVKLHKDLSKFQFFNELSQPLDSLTGSDCDKMLTQFALKLASLIDTPQGRRV